MSAATMPAADPFRCEWSESHQHSPFPLGDARYGVCEHCGKPIEPVPGHRWRQVADVKEEPKDSDALAEYRPILARIRSAVEARPKHVAVPIDVADCRALLELLDGAR